MGMNVRWSDIIIDMTANAYLLVFSCMFAVLSASAFFTLSPSRKIKRHEWRINQKIFQILIWIFITGSIFEFIIEKNFPLISLFYGHFILYTDYGISGLHGLLNAIQLVLFIIFFLRMLKRQGDAKKNYLIIIFFLLWSLMLMARGMMMMQAFHGIILFISLSRLNFKIFVKLFAIVIALMSVFIFLGINRVQGGYNILPLAQVNNNYPEILPDNIIWIYLYFVTPFNNIVNSLTGFENVRYYPYNTLIYPVPNILKDLLPFDPDKFVNLVNSNLNVSSFYDTIYPDFGLEFSWLFIFLYFFLFTVNFSKIKFSIRALLLNACFCNMAFFSMFTNTFTMLILLFEIFIIYLVTQKKLLAAN